MAMNSLTQISVNFNGATFLLDVAEGKMMSLNAIYASAGSPANKEPWRWLETEGSRQFIDSICKILQLSKDDILKTSRARLDRGGGTWAHLDIANKYIEYLQQSIQTKRMNKKNCLYCIMFSNGIIKVGKSVNVLSRIKQHESNANAYGLVIINRYSVEETDITEQELLSFCRGLASKDCDAENHHGEYFIGIDFDKVKKFLGYKDVKVNQVKTNVVKKNIFKKQQESLFV